MGDIQRGRRAVPLAVRLVGLLLDLAFYLQHALFHAVPMLWRLHRMHHADLDIDVTTGVRFHLLETLLSLFIKFAVIALIGAPALAVLIFEVLPNATSMFNHNMSAMSAGVDRIVRWLVVTPDMHRVHDSVLRAERTAISASTFPGGTGCSPPTSAAFAGPPGDDRGRRKSPRSHRIAA